MENIENFLKRLEESSSSKLQKLKYNDVNVGTFTAIILWYPDYGTEELTNSDIESDEISVLTKDEKGKVWAWTPENWWFKINKSDFTADGAKMFKVPDGHSEGNKYLKQAKADWGDPSKKDNEGLNY